jgi:hypothetical protein
MHDRKLHQFIIITIIVPSAHDSVTRRENALGAPVRPPSSSSSCRPCADLHVLNGFVRQLKLPVESLIRGLVYAAPSTRGWRGYRRTGEVTHVIVKTGDCAGDCSGKGRDERAYGAQIRALWRTPSEAKAPHTWRTRVDPFAEVWPEIEAFAQDADFRRRRVGGAEPARAGRFSAGQLRTLQRRFFAWRMKSGPDCEVFFPQTHVPGEQGQSDFTDMRELEVVIAGEPFMHLLYHFVLTYSNWESVSICPSESFEASAPACRRRFGARAACRSSTAPTTCRRRPMSWRRAAAGTSPSATAS